MNRYSAVLLDIDGTLLDSRNEISQNTKSLLRRLDKKGVPIVLASGRSPGETERIARQAGVRAPVVCYNGGLILDESRGILEDRGMEKNVALEFKAFVNREFPEISFNSFLYDIWLADSKDGETRRLAEISGSEVLEGDLASALRTANHAHKFLCAGHSRNVQALRAAAEKKFPALDFALSDSGCLEVVRKGVSKRGAMRKIEEYYGIGAAEIVAVGDYYADAEILRDAGLGIAMGNAPEAVKSVAKRVTASADDEGAYIALKRLRFQPPVKSGELPPVGQS